MNQRPQRTHRRADAEGVFNHFDGTLNAETESIFVG
jgi:hypothetical protein